MSTLDAIVVGIVQGLAEFLPISSSGHLVVTRYFYGANDVSQSYIILLHVGTLLAVCAALWRDILDIAKKFFKKDPEGIRMVVSIAITIIPAALVGIFLADKLDSIFYEDGLTIMGGIPLEPYKFVGLAFIATAYFFIGPTDEIIHDRIDNDIKGTGPESITFAKAIILGCFQAAAVIPGVSRCGATLYGGLKCGFSRQFAARFSFLMSIPVILGAFAKDMLDPTVRTKLIYECDSGQLQIMLLGVAVAAVVGFFAIKLLLYIISTRDLRPFGVYLWILGLICIAS